MRDMDDDIPIVVVYGPSRNLKRRLTRVAAFVLSSVFRMTRITEIVWGT